MYLPDMIRCYPNLKIVYKPDLKDVDGTECYGLFYSSEHTIYICSTKNNTQQKINSTLLHELVHAFFYYTGQGELLGKDEEERIQREESLVIALENFLPFLFEAFMGQEE